MTNTASVNQKHRGYYDSERPIYWRVSAGFRVTGQREVVQYDVMSTIARKISTEVSAALSVT